MLTLSHLLAIALGASIEGIAPHDAPPQLDSRSIISRGWGSHKNLRRLEDAENSEDAGENNNNDDDNSDDKFMAIEQQVEANLVDMFYNAPSEWTLRHWAFFAGMVSIISIFLCWFCVCVISCCCRSKAGETKPLVIRTEEEHNQYTNQLMVDDQDQHIVNDRVRPMANDQGQLVANGQDQPVIDEKATEGEETNGGNSTFDHTEDDTSAYTDSNFDSSFASTDDEQHSFHEYTNSHGNYYRYTGPSRRQLT